MAQKFVKHVSPGEAILDNFTASTYNMFADAANQAARPRPVQRPVVDDATPMFVGPFVSVVNSKPTNAIVPISGTVTQTDVQLRLNPIFQAASQPQFGEWAVYSGSAAGGCAWSAMAGVVTAKVIIPPNGSWIKRADVGPETAGTDHLVLHPGGSAQVLHAQDLNDPSGETWCVLRLGLPQSVTYKAKVVQNPITPGSSGVVELYRLTDTATGFNVNADFNWMAKNPPLEVGTECLVQFMPQDNRWLITGAACP